MSKFTFHYRKRGLERDGKRGGQKEKKNQGEGEKEEMPCIPLSGQRKPQKEGRGGNGRNEREIQETVEGEEEK